MVKAKIKGTDDPLDLNKIRADLHPRVGNILAAHLRVEECLWTILRGAFKNPEASTPELSRLEFGQLLALCRVLTEDYGVRSKFFDAVEKLNAIRNKYAHHLKPVGMEDRLKDFGEFTGSNLRPALARWTEREDPLTDALEIIENLAHLLASMEMKPSPEREEQLRWLRQAGYDL